MTQKIDAVLDRVKEPESGLSISQLGLVKKLRHNKNRKKLTVYIDTIGPAKGCCAIMSAMLLSTTLENLAREFESEFPDLTVEFI